MSATESRREHAICYKNRKKTMLWQADYIGVITMDDGLSYWISVYEQKLRNGDPCIGIKLRAKGEER